MSRASREAQVGLHVAEEQAISEGPSDTKARASLSCNGRAQHSRANHRAASLGAGLHAGLDELVRPVAPHVGPTVIADVKDRHQPLVALCQLHLLGLLRPTQRPGFRPNDPSAIYNPERAGTHRERAEVVHRLALRDARLLATLGVSSRQAPNEGCGGWSGSAAHHGVEEVKVARREAAVRADAEGVAQELISDDVIIW
jgi:hypothetical protein